MIAGGNWETQNKILPGAYIRFISELSGYKKSSDPTTEPTNTSAKLGVGILGYMKLGSN